jgi:hypothetical protein
MSSSFSNMTGIGWPAKRIGSIVAAIYHRSPAEVHAAFIAAAFSAKIFYEAFFAS